MLKKKGEIVFESNIESYQSFEDEIDKYPSKENLGRNNSNNSDLLEKKDKLNSRHNSIFNNNDDLKFSAEKIVSLQDSELLSKLEGICNKSSKDKYIDRYKQYLPTEIADYLIEKFI